MSVVRGGVVVSVGVSGICYGVVDLERVVDIVMRKSVVGRLVVLLRHLRVMAIPPHGLCVVPVTPILRGFVVALP